MRRRLVVVALATTSMVAIAFVVPLALLVRVVARDRALALAEADARAIAPVLAVSADPDALTTAMRSTDAGGAGRMTVVLADGTRLGAPMPEDAGLAESRRGRALSVETSDGARVLAPVVLAGGTAVVVVDVPESLLRRGVTRSWALLAVLAAVLVVAAVAVADALAGGLVRPVRRLAQAAGAVGAGDLTTRVTPDGPPEIARAGREFNAMTARVVGLLAAERELVADLSHRLRTPLTRLRLDVEALGDTPAGTRLAADADAVEAVVDEVIAEARRTTSAEATSDLAAVARERVDFWRPLAEEEGRRCELRAPDVSVRVPAPAGDIAAALDALLGNVFAHTPEGTDFAVSVRVEHGSAVLVVDDAGPGIPDAAAARGVSGSGSTGLGLDIARRTAERAGGGLERTQSPDGGARVLLRFPLAG